MGRLLSLFIVVPLIDLFLLMKVGAVVGFANTVLLVVATGILGASLFRHAWAEATEGWHRALAEGRLPEEGVLGAAMLLVGGAFLITPGIVTDVAGLALLLRPSRQWLAARLAPLIRARFERGVATGRVRVVHGGFDRRHTSPAHAARPEGERSEEGSPVVIETSAEVVGRRVSVRRRARPPRKRVLDAEFVVEDG
ncbi:MAG: FxsA family protein [Myxococcota bacterium]